MTKLLLLSLICINSAYAQSLVFTYDSEGNQVKREMVLITINSIMSNNEETEQVDEMLLQTVNSINFNESIIELYPNPVIDLLNVEWSSELKLTEILLFDNRGKLLQIKKVYEGTIREIFDLSTYASGIYYIRVLDVNKKNKSYKIIKK